MAKLNATGSALVYSTYLGGSANDGGDGIAVDSSGNAYVTGQAESANFPAAHPLQANLAGKSNVFVAKLNSAGSALVYSTYLGGNDQNYVDYGSGIAVDSSGNAYVTGQTDSSNFPTASPFQANLGAPAATNAFVSKLNWAASTSTLSLIYSTYLGGNNSDSAYGIAVDSSGNAYITGSTNSPNFPTASPLQSFLAARDATNAFVSKLNWAASTSTLSLAYSTYLGGSNNDSGDAIAVDSYGNAYVAGVTNSSDFPTTLDAFQRTLGGAGANNAFVAEISTSAAAPGVSLSTNNLTFPGQPVGSTSAAQSVTLTNSGTYVLTLAVGISGDFALTTTGTSCPSSESVLAPGASCTINVTFTPAGTGTRTGALTISDNVIGTPQSVSLTGTGTAPVAGVSPPSLTFGNQDLGTTSASQPVTVSNPTGTAALTITSIATSPGFAQTNTCDGGNIAIGGSCTINVTFSPALTATAGTITGTLTITDNDSGVAGSMQTVTLSGTAVNPVMGPPPVSLTDNEAITVVDTPLVVAMPPLLTATAPVAYYSVGSLGFGAQSQTLPLTVSNLGQANLSLDAVASPASPFSIAQMECTNGALSPAHDASAGGSMHLLDLLHRSPVGHADRRNHVYGQRCAEQSHQHANGVELHPDDSAQWCGNEHGAAITTFCHCFRSRE